MFTRCPQCNTVFRISATQLRVAGGDVRCGNCAHVFSALGNLSDEIPGGELPETDGSSGSAAGTESAAGQSGESQAENELEFDAPERTWSQYFIDATRKPGEEAAPASGDDGDVPLDGELETITADPEEWRAFLDEMDESPAARWDEDDLSPDALGREQQVYVVDQAPTGNFAERDTAQDAAVDGSAAVPPIAAPGSDDGTEDSDQPDGDVFLADDFPYGDEPIPETNGFDAIDSDGDSDDARGSGDMLPADALDADALDWQQESAVPAARHGLWLAASLAMLALLLAQAVHLKRDSLAIHETVGPQLQSLYERLGAPLYPEWPLEAYRVRRAEAIAGGSAPDSLDITAAVETSGSGMLGLPLVRVALRDQWANVVASRVFEPEHYLAAEMPDVVAAGTRIPVRLSVVDPGNEARGFVVDLCLPRRSGLDCQLSRDPFAP